MHEIHVRLDLKFLLFSLSSAVVPGFLPSLIFSTAFFLVTVIGMEVTKIDTHFLTLISSFKDTCWCNSSSSCSGSI